MRLFCKVFLLAAHFATVYCTISFIDATDFSWRVPRVGSAHGHVNGTGRGHHRRPMASVNAEDHGAASRTYLQRRQMARARSPQFHRSKQEAWQDDWMRLLNRRLAYANHQRAKCHDVPGNLTLCSTMGYGRMRIPNFLEQWNLNDIIAEADVWNKRLAEANCNDAHSRLFLCSVLAPVCVENKAEPVPPCRNICQSVQRTCERPLHLRYGFTWPDVLSCDRFPTEDEEVCIGPDSLESISGSTKEPANEVSTTLVPTPTTVIIGPTKLTASEGTSQVQAVESVCSACTPTESVEELLLKACSSHIVFRTRLTKITRQTLLGSTWQHYDINLAVRRIRVITEQPVHNLPKTLKPINLRALLEKGSIHEVIVNASNSCSCSSVLQEKPKRRGSFSSGTVLVFANAVLDRAGRNQEEVHFEMNGFVRLGRRIDKTIRRATQKLKRQPLEILCASISKISSAIKSHVARKKKNRNRYHHRQFGRKSSRNRGGKRRTSPRPYRVPYW